MRYQLTIIRSGKAFFNLMSMLFLIARMAQGAPGDISTVAGNGTPGYSGDGMPATQTSLDFPRASFVDALGNIYIADTYNHRIRKIDPNGSITTVAGNGTGGFSGDGSPATGASLFFPNSVFVRGNTIYIADSFNDRIRKVDANGIITTVAGSEETGYSGDDGPATLATLDYPTGVLVDIAGNIYIADYFNHRIRKVDTSGIITTIAGGGPYDPGDGRPAIASTLGYPRSIALDPAGNLLIAAEGTSSIRKVLKTNGIISTIAGGTGPAPELSLLTPTGLTVDPEGNIYVADFQDHRIKKIVPAGPSGFVSTIAGNGSAGFTGDGGPADTATFNAPTSAFVDGSGNLFITDSGNERVRRIDSAAPADNDGDGIYIAYDNCPTVYNPDQADSDHDGIGDVCSTLGSISGEVTDEVTGEPVANASLTVWLENNSVSYGQTDPSGTYSVAGQNPGAYKVSACATGYVCEFYNNVSNIDDATIVNVSAGMDSPNIDFALSRDSDNDTIADALDNCPTVRNTDQRDMNGNGIGDVCDPDADGDGTLNETDNCLLTVNPDQLDSDGDGLGDACTMVHCVTTSAQLQAALTTATGNAMHDIIRIVQGTYGISGNGGSRFSYLSNDPYSLVIQGGYASTPPGCSVRALNPANTVLDGENIFQGSTAGVVNVYDQSLTRTARIKLTVEGITVQNGRSNSMGGMLLYSNYGLLSVSDSIIQNNTAIDSVGGLHLGSSNGSVQLIRSIIRNNQANYQGGVSVAVNAAGFAYIADNLIAGNSATYNYGGLHLFVSGNADVINNTITANSASMTSGRGGGALLHVGNYTSVVNLYNNILWGNNAQDGGDIFEENNYPGSEVNAFNNDFDPAKLSVSFANQANNVNSDPLFVNSAAGDYRLSASSLLVNAGRNSAPNLPNIDLDGNSRVLGAVVDIGAYEAVPLPATGATLTTSPGSSQQIGQPVTVTAAGSGGSGTYQYQFRVLNGSTWEVKQAYSDLNTWTWNTGGYAAGTYTVQVLVRNAGSSAAYEAQRSKVYTLVTDPPATGVTFTTSPGSSQQIGQPVTVTAAGSGGSGTYQYQFRVLNGSTWEVKQAYSDLNTWTWNTGGYAAGTYTIQVFVRNAGSSAAYEAQRSKVYTLVTDPPATGVTFTTSPGSSQQIGQPVTVTAAGSGGSGTYQYQFRVLNGSTWEVKQAYSDLNTWTWNTGGYAAGTYTIQVFVRNAGSSAAFEAQLARTYTLQ